jgi:two-component system response regulator YesN
LNKWAEKIVQLLKENSTKIMDDSHQQIISRVQSYIQEHLEEGLSLLIMSEHVNLHPVYLSKVYKSVTGQTIGDYIFSIRMERAAYFLEYTDLKIVDISGKLGFLAPPHFIKIFKKHYNCTPQEYRNSR